MKILLINNFHYHKGGSEAVYFNTAELLRGHGHDVINFSMQNEQNEPCEQSPYFVRPNTSVSKLNGILRYFYNKEAAKHLEQLIRAEKPDIAHVHLFWGGLSPSIFRVLKKYRIPLVHTAHDYRMICPAYSFKTPDGKICEACRGKKFYKCALKRCSKGSLLQSIVMASEMYLRNLLSAPLENIDGFIFVSHFSREKHIQYIPKFDSARTLVLYNTTAPSPQYINRGERRYFLFYGRLSFEKGINTLLEAFAGIPHISLKIVGTGPEEAKAVDYIRKHKLENIELIGYKSGNELKALVSGASFVIVPSECYENNPMTIVEAYTLGVPVIGSRLGGIPEIIEEGKTGFTIKPLDPGNLRDKVIAANALNCEEYARMIEHTQQFAMRHFNPETHYNCLIDFYVKCIQKQN